MYELLNYFLVVVVVVVCYSGCNTQHLCNYFKCRLQIVSGNCGNTFCTELVSCCRWKVGNGFFFRKMAVDFNFFYFILHIFCNFWIIKHSNFDYNFYLFNLSYKFVYIPHDWFVLILFCVNSHKWFGKFIHHSLVLCDSFILLCSMLEFY